ncbi:2S seed storage albumin protein-like [Salvia miltiorrhiza]|uniref:2S seed storage albumin protein-like n=1 Tax=Salvia miltiorrhiza TaxID=226208 RepID=UPI0025AD8CBE|nr:2S seed storage albumin protein-like [Salvia miltiorrhiza]
MAKFALSLLSLLLLLASAAAVGITNPIGRCRGEIERQRLSSCQQYLIDGSRFDSTPQEEGRGWREAFPRCCDELEQINQQCRCEAVKQVAMEQREAGALQGREMREMMQTAQRLPSLCRISPQYCDNIGERPMF